MGGGPVRLEPGTGPRHHELAAGFRRSQREAGGGPRRNLQRLVLQHHPRCHQPADYAVHGSFGLLKRERGLLARAGGLEYRSGHPAGAVPHVVGRELGAAGRVHGQHHVVDGTQPVPAEPERGLLRGLRGRGQLRLRGGARRRGGDGHGFVRHELLRRGGLGRRPVLLLGGRNECRQRLPERIRRRRRRLAPAGGESLRRNVHPRWPRNGPGGDHGQCGRQRHPGAAFDRGRGFRDAGAEQQLCGRRHGGQCQGGVQRCGGGFPRACGGGQQHEPLPGVQRSEQCVLLQRNNPDGLPDRDQALPSRRDRGDVLLHERDAEHGQLHQQSRRRLLGDRLQLVAGGQRHELAGVHE
ncbi:MAG: hypothetical protein BWX79_01692 [Alphaproteobacteria bacterium ADurb.Bin100]|nr:MAG: hypothetical protein BWX79_01692 [Alphaproteobacteria bacterium ADurb.Bin100]